MNFYLHWGQEVCLYSQRRLRAPYDQTDLNLWFRLIFIGVGRTFWKLGPFGARGSTGPTTWPIGLGWACQMVRSGQPTGVLIPVV
jgi:hypothetical protein